MLPLLVQLARLVFQVTLIPGSRKEEGVADQDQDLALQEVPHTETDHQLRRQEVRRGYFIISANPG